MNNHLGANIRVYRKNKGFTQEEFAEKTGLASGYISTIERGVTFPRYDKLITILNTLGVSADAIFCDVLSTSNVYKESILSEKLASLPPESRQRILQLVELMIQQETNSL